MDKIQVRISFAGAPHPAAGRFLQFCGSPGVIKFAHHQTQQPLIASELAEQELRPRLQVRGFALKPVSHIDPVELGSLPYTADSLAWRSLQQTSRVHVSQICKFGVPQLETRALRFTTKRNNVRPGVVLQACCCSCLLSLFFTFAT